MLGQRSSVGQGAPSACRLWFPDNCHINGRSRPGDVHSLAFSDRGLRITRRNVYDPTVIRRRTIVLALGGEGGSGKAKHKCGDEKKLSHLATFLSVVELKSTPIRDTCSPRRLRVGAPIALMSRYDRTKIPATMVRRKHSRRTESLRCQRSIARVCLFA
jgi:hypothetical protein